MWQRGGVGLIWLINWMAGDIGRNPHSPTNHLLSHGIPQGAEGSWQWQSKGLKGAWTHVWARDNSPWGRTR